MQGHDSWNSRLADWWCGDCIKWVLTCRVCYSIASPLTSNKNGRPSKQIHTQLQDVEAQRQSLCLQATLPPDQP